MYLPTRILNQHYVLGSEDNVPGFLSQLQWLKLVTLVHSSSYEASEKRLNLKRRRNSSDDELENQPPTKIYPKLEDELNEQSAQNVVVESSSCSSDDEASQFENIEQPGSVFTDLEYNADSFLSPPSLPESCVLSPLENVARGESTPHSNKRSNPNKPACPILPKRKCPLPGLSWADPNDVWNSMCECDMRTCAKKNPSMFDNHPNLQPRMRAILLDWLNEIGEFAYVTDGACTTEEILLEELLILQILSWSITPITINSWLNVYMQLASEGRSAKRRLLSESDVGANALRGYTFVFPQYSSLEFVISGQLIDLAVLHVDVNQYPYSALEPCYRWLCPFVSVVRAEGAVCVVRGGDGEFVQRGAGLPLICPDINLDESHRIQSHNVSLDMFVSTLTLYDGEFVQRDAGLPLICPDINLDESHRIQSHNVSLDMFVSTLTLYDGEFVQRDAGLPLICPDINLDESHWIQSHNDKVYQLMLENETTQDTGASTSQEHEVIYPPTPPQSDHKSPKTPTTKTPSTRHQLSPLPDLGLLAEE
ncbi:Cyclin E [Operophtera brumata]|uniref:Cyclin E n=1 Tax=Operophtera brumata TaxID=104452 RepID=A0A0L7LT83_OPEBR|nr:Cyclin E [Operophtera brumata]